MQHPLKESFTLQRVDIVGSTNDELKEAAADGAPSGTVLVATTQREGRGRHGNAWISPAGNLYMSLLLRLECDAQVATQLTFLSAIALADALPVDVSLKWPNDVLCDGKKLGGLLLEASSGPGGKADWVVIGLGLNIAHHPDADDVSYPATSLKAHGSSHSVDELLDRIFKAFQVRIDQWLKDGFSAIRDDWMARAAFLGETIRLNLGHREVQGTFEGINESGELLLSQPNGEPLTVSAGELFVGGSHAASH